MNPHASASAGLGSMVVSLWRNKALIVRMTNRNIALRYKGSILGLLWSFLSPMLMLGVYAFMFLYVFQAKWGSSSPNPDATAYVPILFTGLIVHAFLAEIILTSPTTILANVNFVKKVVFPLEILAAVTVGSAFINAIAAAFILLLMQVVMGGQPHITALMFPIILLPLALIGLGVSWFLSALGVFVRDIAQVAGFVATATLFLSPIFYPIDALPNEMREWMLLNPLTLIVEQARRVMVYGIAPDVLPLMSFSAVAVCVAVGGFFLFQKLRKGFADVL
jgi:lipopolysaccharide transport system permease protein